MKEKSVRMKKSIAKKYRPYPEYKDSGVEWLGEIPAHWNTDRAGYLFSELELPPPSDTGVITAYRDGEVTLGENRRAEGYTFAIQEVGYQGVRVGDLVIQGMDAFAGAIGVSDSVGKCSPEYLVLEPQSAEIDNRYYSEILRMMAKRGFILVVCNAVRERAPRFRYPEFKRIILPVMPRAEQESIISFLNHQTAKIDALLAKYGSLLELLAEKRSALISHAVTKGLDPAAPMKDSGVEWLGEIPEKWSLKKLKYLCRITTGSKDTINAVDEGEYPFFVRSQEIERINSYSFDGEAVLTAGDGAGVGKVFHYFKGRFDFHQRVYMMYSFKKIDAMYFFYFLREMFSKVALDGSAKSTVDSLRMPVFLNFLFSFPEKPEQKQILTFLHHNTAQVDALVAKVERAIELLKERRVALISAAVTGKIDLREE